MMHGDGERVESRPFPDEDEQYFQNQNFRDCTLEKANEIKMNPDVYRKAL
jgi:hypothetical protein